MIAMTTIIVTDIVIDRIRLLSNPVDPKEDDSISFSAFDNKRIPAASNGGDRFVSIQVLSGIEDVVSMVVADRSVTDVDVD
jgi:hypothetical protein